MNSDKRVLVTDGTARAAVAACRGLARGGYRVSATAAHRPAAAHWSRCCDRRYFTPDPRHEPDAFVARLNEILDETRHDVLIPSTDAALTAVSRHRDLLDVRTGLPAADAVDRAFDKAACAEAATGAGLPPPPSAECETVDEARAAAESIGFPLVLKPARSLDVATGEFRRLAIARDEADLEPALAQGAVPLIVQRLVSGRIVSVGGVVHRGRLRAVAVSAYERTWPPEAGNAAASITIDPPGSLVERTLKVVTALGWEGIFELELVEDAERRLWALDFNPRPYGSMALAIRAGANLPAVWSDLLLGGDPPFVEARAGLRYRWEDADLQHGLWQLRRGNAPAALRVLRPHRCVVHAYFELADPGPSLARSVRLLRRATRRG